MKFIFIILLFSFNNALATPKGITCGFGECRPDFTSSIYLEKELMTFIDVGDFNDEVINVDLPVNQEPRALFLSVNNNNLGGGELFVNFQSKRSGYDTADFFLIGDVFRDVVVNVDGYQGVSGRSASDICAERILAGQYGEFYRTQFLNRRQADPSLPMDKCVEFDVEQIQRTAFSCYEETGDAGYREEDFPLVNVQRVKYKQKCTGISNKYRCVKRKIRAQCEWEALPLGHAVAGKPCTNKWGGNNCEYTAATSCWNGNDLNRTNGNGVSSYPPQGATNPWDLIFDNTKCSFPGEGSPSPYNPDSGLQGMKGGVNAINITTQIQEKLLGDAERNGTLENFCRTYSSGPSGPGWKFIGVTDIFPEEPGLDPDTQQPLPGSVWEIQETGFFQTCSIFGDFEVLAPIIEFWTTHGEVGNSCTDATIAEDPYRLIPWTQAGVEQDRIFGTELILCSPDNCPMETITKVVDASLDTITPTAGTNGTTQGDAVLFVYDITNLIASANPGLGGDGGNNDIPQYLDNKYCIKRNDADTQGINSSFALSPVVYFDHYLWDAFQVGSGRPNGSDAPFSRKGIQLYKKIDSSVRYLIKNDNF